MKQTKESHTLDTRVGLKLIITNLPTELGETGRRVATCKPGKLGLTSFSETLALFFIQFLSFGKMPKIQAPGRLSIKIFFVPFGHIQPQTDLILLFLEFD